MRDELIRLRLVDDGGIGYVDDGGEEWFLFEFIGPAIFQHDL